MYRQQIAKILNCDLATARLVEGFMRLESGTLDNLSPAKFKREARIGFACVAADRVEAESLAKSYGL